MTSDITIRAFETIDEYRACVALQEETWGVGFSERVPPAILKVSQILGGVSAGAYDADGRLVGFVFGMTGLRDGEIVHWSDMLAVRPGVRDSGLGRRLKAYQRAEVMGRGVTKMFWTFDPLRSRNAYLNFEKLGIVVREYAEDMYGQTDSPLHRGIGTDRFIALWLLDSERVRARLATWGAEGQEAGDREAAPTLERVEVSEAPRALTAERAEGHPTPAVPRLDLGSDVVVVEIPSDVAGLMEDDLDLARAWRAATRETFRHYLARGYEVVEFLRGDVTSAYAVQRVTKLAK